MDISPISWADVGQLLPNLGYPHHQRIAADVAPLQQRFGASCAPFVVTGPEIPMLLVVKGDLYPNERLCGPPIEFAITFPPMYPEAYPVITIEPPPPGWAIKPHPNVGTDGQCYLTSVSSWTRGPQSLLRCVEELQGALRTYPFASSDAQQPPSSPPPPPQQQQHHQQRQQHASGNRPATGGGRPFAMPSGALETLFVGSAMLSAKCTVAVTKAVVQGLVGGGSGGSSGNGRAERQHQYEEQLRQQREEADAIFAGVLSGRPLPPGTSVTFPPHSGLGTVICAEHPAAPLRMTAQAPPPLPPVTDPTPEEQHTLALQQQEQRRREEEAREAAKPKPVGALGFGLKALSSGARAASGLAAKARNSVEAKVRDSEACEDTNKFREAFPVEAQHEPLASAYACKLMMGDGTGILGTLFITDTQLHWLLDVAWFVKKHPEQPAPHPVKVSVPLQYVVTIVRGEAAGHGWLLVALRDGTVRPFFDFRTSVAGKVGSVASASLSGSPLERAFNWIDHKWRAATPVPVPGYTYGRPLMPQAPAPQQNYDRFF